MPTIADFLANIGVNTHVDDKATSYRDVALVQASLAYLGVSLIRDHAYDISLPAYRALAAAGIKLDLILDDDPKAELDALVPIFPAIRFLEGPNEVDYQHVLTNGIADPVRAAIAEQRSVAAALAATPALRGTPLLAESMANSGNLAAYAGNLAFATVANLHSYAAYGASPNAILANDVALARALSRLPIAVTETGYYTMPTDDSGVTESVQARLTLDTLFDAAALGISPTFLYELLDEAADPANTDSQLHYGLFHADGSPKPAATALHHLTTILSAANITPGRAPTLSLTVGNAPPTARTITLTAAAGTTVVALWAEPPLWDPVTHTEIAPPKTPTTLALGTTVASVLVFDPLLGTAPIATYANVSTLTLLLTDHPLLLQLSAAALPLHADPISLPVPPAPATDPRRLFDAAIGIQLLGDTAAYRFFDATLGAEFRADTAEPAAILATCPDIAPDDVSVYDPPSA